MVSEAHPDAPRAGSAAGTFDADGAVYRMIPLARLDAIIDDLERL